VVAVGLAGALQATQPLGELLSDGTQFLLHIRTLFTAMFDCIVVLAEK